MFDLLDKVVNTLLLNAIAPVVAKTGRLDKAISGLKRTVVELLQDETKASKETIAKHLKRSERWAYRELEDSEEEEVEQGSNALLFDVVSLFYARSPRALSLEDIFVGVEGNHKHLDLKTLKVNLKRFVDLGFIVPAENEGEYGLGLRVTHIQETGLEERLARIGRTSQEIMPVAFAYARGDEDARFGAMHLNVTPKQWAAFVKDVHHFIVERINRAILLSLEEDPSEVGTEQQTIIFATASHGTVGSDPSGIK